MASNIKRKSIPIDVGYWPACEQCPKLHKNSMSVCMEGEGPEHADFMVIGEAPSEEDDELNRPFVSGVGEFLRNDLLVSAGIPEFKVRFTNAIRCHKNKTPTVLEIKKCRRYLEVEIKAVKPKVIVGMGNAALATMLQFIYKGKNEEGTSKKADAKVSGIMRWQGHLIWIKEFSCWFMPTFTPLYCLVRQGKRSSYATELVIDDLIRAWKAIDKPVPINFPKSIVLTSKKDVSDMLWKMMQSKVFAYDIETGGKGRSIDKRIIGSSFACSERVGYYVPQRIFDSSKSLMIKLDTLLNSKKHLKVMHNGAFEDRIHSSTGKPISGKYFDTMLSAHLVDENFSKRLKDLTWLYTPIGGYDVELEKYKFENGIKEDYSLIPEELLAPYGGFDAVVTFILYKRLSVLMDIEKVTPLFNKVVMPVRKVMSDTEMTGFYTDLDRALLLSSCCDKTVKKLELKVYESAGREFNIGSPVQLQEVLFKDMGYDPLKKTKTGYSTDKASMEHVLKQGGAIAVHLSDLSYVNTMWNTHIGQAIEYTWPDHRIHTNYNLSGAVTGRTSCIAEGSLVKTGRGLIPIEDIFVGDIVLSHTGVYRKVRGVLNQGVKEVFQLTTDTFRSILCTKDHRFFTPNGWVAAQKVTEVYGVSVENVNDGRRVFTERDKVIRRQSVETDRRQSSEYPRNYTSKCSSRVKEDAFFGKVSCRGDTSVLQKQDGKQKPYEREGGSKSSQLERRAFRWKRWFGIARRWKSLSLSSRGVSEAYGISSERPSREYDGSSYRRESNEQRNRQFNALYSRWSSVTTPKVEKVTGFSPMGEIQVYDLVVDIDASFVVEGFLAHNCSNPSLQNVPTDRLVRSLYIATPGNSLVEADLKSAEIAVIAAVSGEETFIDAFAKGIDIHSATYRRMYNLPDTYKCSKLERRQAKTINFGLIYGLTIMGLSSRLDISEQEAKEFMDLYFHRLPNVARWMEKQKLFVVKNGYVVSVFGRKRRLPYAFSDGIGEVSRAERQAMNSPIQSAAADYTYIGLNRLSRRIRLDRLEGQIVHTVHDCVVTDTPPVEVDIMAELIRESFEVRVKALPIQMRVDVEIGEKWGQTNESRLEGIFKSVGLKLAV